MIRARHERLQSSGIWIHLRIIATVTVAMCTIASAADAGRPSPPPASRRVFEELILARIKAYGRGDAVSYARLVAPDFVHISDVGGRRTTKQLEPYITAGRSPGTNFTVRDLSFNVRGQLAVVDAEVIETDALASQRLREMDVFEAHGSRWVYLAHSETIVQEEDVSPTPADRQTLEQYEGRYTLAAGKTDYLSVKDGQLVGSDAPGGEPTPLFRIAADTFVVRGDPSVTIFERNNRGVVIGYALRLGNGRVVRATKAQ